MISDRMDINNLLVEMRSMKSQINAFNPEGIAEQTRGVSGPLADVKTGNTTSNFGELMQQAVNNVNDLQANAKTMATQYEQGIGDASITDVMIASQKSSVAFQGMLQVRNKVVEAYRDVMNMPV